MNFKKLFSAALAGCVVWEMHAQNAIPSAATGAGLKTLSGHVAAAWRNLAPVGRPAGTQEMRLAISLPLRNEAELGALRASLYDPASPDYRHFLTPAEFTRRFGPTEEDYQSVAAFAEANGLRVVATHPNRLVLDVVGTVASVEKTFHLTLRTYQHPYEARKFFAPDSEPSLDLKTPVLQISGLDDYSLPQPCLRPSAPRATNSNAEPMAGSGPSATFIGRDFRTAYLPGVTNLTGAGQSVGLLEFDGYYTNDVARYCATGGITTSVTVSNILIDGGPPTISSNNNEVALDIQMVLAVAPSVSAIYVYEAPNPSPWVDMLSRMANDNTAKQLSCSWGHRNAGSVDTASEQVFVQMIMQGQTFLSASGDSDAYTSGVPFPFESTNITAVGGTTLTNTSDGSFGAETVWNWGVSISPTSYDGVGSSGGVSLNFALPPWQQNMDTNLTSAGGSLSQRNVPDVALTADNIYSISSNGTNSGAVGGTSCSAPLWAGFMALVNQQAAALGDAPVGFLNPPVYAIGNGPNYTNCFHDVVTGSNTWSKSTAKFIAVPGYDLCTGWGTPTGSNLINALMVNTAPVITTQPLSLTMGLGGPATFAVSAYGTKPVSYQWFFTNALSGATNLSLVISNVDFTNAGNYFLVLSNAFGSATSAVVTLTVTAAPVIAQSPSNQSGFFGQPVSFSVAAFGAQPLAYQWRINSNAIVGATGPNFLILGVRAGDEGNYDVVVTNVYGSVTSSVAVLTTLFAPVYNGVLAGWDMHPLANGQNIFGPSPLAPTTNAPYLGVTGLTRGSGVSTSGFGAAKGWGGNAFTNVSEAAAIASNQVLTISFTVSNTFKAAFTSVGRFDYRRGGGGPPGGAMQYQVGNGAFTDFASPAYTVITSAGASLGSFDLLSVGALQNVPAGTNVTFRIVNWGGTSASSGQWYIYDVANSTALDFTIQGSITPTVAPAGSGNNQFLTAYDAGPGLVSGENLMLTNRSGTSMFAWSSPTSSVAVANWTLEGPLSELQQGNGNSLYRINVNPTNSPTYYIFATTNTGPYAANEAVTWLTTADHVSFTVAGTNAAIGADGIFIFPAPPAIVVSPQGTNIFAGKNVSLNVTANGTATLHYQWLNNGGPVSGALSNRLSFTPAVTTNSGNYSVVVTNLFGSATSSVARLNVAALPALTFANSATGFTLSADGGVADNAYIIQTTTNLVPPVVWLPLQTNIIGTNGQIRFTATNQNYPAGFYRVQIP